MIRVNLLPREILEKRRFERGIWYVGAGLLIGLAVVLVIFGINAWRIASRNALLQQSEETASQLRNQAEAYRIFEEKEDVLSQRKAAADVALASRVDWGRLTNELSLILPSDVWLYELLCDEDEGTDLRGYAVDAPTDVPDLGHKSIAKTMIRLADLEQIDAVWLLESLKEPSYEDSGDPVVRFQITSGVVRPPAEATQQTASVPAPPSQSAQ